MADSYGSYKEDTDDGSVEYYQRQIEKSRIRQLESTQRSRVVLAETEDVGSQTAQELLRQREQLENTNRKLDTIDQLSKVNQRHLNGLKGMFSNFKSWVTGANSVGSTDKTDSTNPESRLAGVVHRQEKERQSQGEDVSGFFAVEEEERGYRGASGGGAQPQKSQVPSADEYEVKIDQNLGIMRTDVSRLRELALGLGDEIEDQNELIGEISGKAEGASDVLGHQNKQMNRIIRR